MAYTGKPAKEKKTEESYIGSRGLRPWAYHVILLVNVLAFLFIGVVYVRSTESYREKLYNESIRNVESVNAASANAAYTYTRSMGIKIDDTVSFIRARALNYGGAVEYLTQSNTNIDRQFQLVLSGSYDSAGKLSFGDYSGISVRKEQREDGSLETLKTPIAYGGGYYDIFAAFTDVDDENLSGLCFTPEFTDPDTKQKCFAVYRHIVMNDSAGQKRLYTLLLAIDSQTAMNAYNMQTEYDSQSTVLIDAEGDYIIKNSDYRNANFFDYIVNYNGLTTEQRSAIRALVTDMKDEGAAAVDLFYKNHTGEDCVFVVTPMENGWYGVTCVPIASFSLEDDSVNYSLIILVLFLALFLVDAAAIVLVGRELNRRTRLAVTAQEQADQANRAKSRFLSTMSHELRTPLNAITGLTALSRDCEGVSPVLADYLGKIDSSSKLLLQLISDILDISAIESDKLRLNQSEFDVTKLISLLSALYYDQAVAKGIEFSVVLRDMHSETLVGDATRLNQVLLNFLSNAIKYTPVGGTVTLSAQQKSREGDKVLIRFEVRDTGCGISDELRERLFQPFERSTGEIARKAGGTGLGLSIAKSLTELMGGVIGVDSQEGVGSCFWCEIPFAISAQKVLRSFSPISGMSVLAAVNNDDERVYIGQLLESFGMEYALAGSAREATELLRERRDEGRAIDLCLLDWKFSDLTALDAVKRLRREFDGDALTVAVLAYDVAKAEAECAGAGADSVLGKPIFPSAFYNFLQDMAAGSVHAASAATPELDLSGRRVLLVEDNDMNLMIAQLLLSKVGLEVDAARDGREGYERFSASPAGYYDAILMDVQMPVMNGYQATEAIRASAHPQARTVPILAMTADAFSEDVEKARAAGMNEHLSKPIEPKLLYSALNKYLNHGDQNIRSAPL